MDNEILFIALLAGGAYLVYRSPIGCVFRPLECAEQAITSPFTGVAHFFSGLFHKRH